MKKLISLLSVGLILASMSSCSLFNSGEEGQSTMSREQMEGYLNRESDAEMSYSGPFYFGNFDGIDAGSVAYSEARRERVGALVSDVDKGISLLRNVDKKIREERKIFEWYISEIKTLEPGAKKIVNQLYNASNVSSLSSALSALALMEKEAQKVGPSPAWGYLQFQKYANLVELTELYTVEAASLMMRATTLYYLLEADTKNPGFKTLNAEFLAKMDPLSDEVSVMVEDLYYQTALADYGEKVLFTADYNFAKQTLVAVDLKLAEAKKSLAEYTGSNEFLSKEMLALLTKKVSDMEEYRNNIAATLDSIPASELISTGEKQVSVQKTEWKIMPVAFADDLTDIFNDTFGPVIKKAKSIKNLGFAAVRVTGQAIKDVYDKSGAHEVIKDGAQIVNGGIEIVNSGVEVSVSTVQGVYYGDLTWKNFKQKIESEKAELHEKFVRGTLGKEQYDEMIKQVDTFQHNTQVFVNNMSEFSGFVTTVVTKSSDAGKFVTNVTKGVGDEAKKVLDTATDFSKNLAIVMHPETTKEQTRKALLDIYGALKDSRDDEGKLKDVELPDLIDLTKEQVSKELGLTEDEEKEFVDQLKGVFEDELKGEESKDPEKKDTTKKPDATADKKDDTKTNDTSKTGEAGKNDETKPDEKSDKPVNTTDAVADILMTPGLSDEEIADKILAEIVKGLPPIKPKNGEDVENPEGENTDEISNDIDEDGILNEADNCPQDSNSEQGDLDKDLIGNACDPDCSGDMDSDSHCDEVDNCPMKENSDQKDSNKNGMGDVCDDSAPLLSEIAGGMNGSMTVTDVFISDELRATATKEGCDLSELENSKGQVKPVSVTIVPTSETGGILKLSGAGAEGTNDIPFTYVDGVLTGSMVKEGANMSVNMNYSGASPTGTMNIDYMEGAAKIKADMSFPKP